MKSQAMRVVFASCFGWALAFGVGCGRHESTSSDASSPTRTVLRYYEEVHNAKRLEVIPDLFAADFVAYGPSGEETCRGPAGELEHMKASIAFFADLHTEVEEVLANSARVTVRWTGKGTHAGKTVVLPGVSVFQVEDAKIQRAWHYYDNLHSLRQLGYTLQAPPDS